jgi:signal peptidase II
MEFKKIIRSTLIAVILLSNIGCDQVSKYIVRQRIDEHEKISLVRDHVTLMKIENTGAFLSLGSTLPSPIRFILLSLIPVFVLLSALSFLFTKRNLSIYTIVGIGFVVGGGIGNLFDRIVHGSVTDFIHIDFGLFQTGIFNLADVSIMTGIFIILAEMIMRRSQRFDTPVQ